MLALLFIVYFLCYSVVYWSLNKELLLLIKTISIIGNGLLLMNTSIGMQST